GELVALGGEEARHALRVVLVHLTAIRNEVKLCHELFEKSGRCVDLTVASAIREVNLARKHSRGVATLFDRGHRRRNRFTRVAATGDRWGASGGSGAAFPDGDSSRVRVSAVRAPAFAG